MPSPPRYRSMLAFALALALALAPSPAPRAASASATARPGPAAGGRVRLPSGWWLSPSGRRSAVGDFPLGLDVSPDGRWAVASCSGHGGGQLDVVDLAAGRRVQSLALPGTWVGVTFCSAGRRFAASGGVSNVIHLYDFAGGRAVHADSIVLGPPWSAGGQYPQGRRIDYGPGAIWPTGLAADDARGTLCVVSRFDSALRIIDLARRTVTVRVPLGAVPWTCLPARSGGRVYVSLWSASAVAVVDAGRARVERVIAVGSHPCELAESPDGGRLFVAEANRNAVSVVDLAEGRVTETLRTSPSPDEPPGSTPDGLALDAAGHRLYVAAADANCIAVFDVARPGHSRPLGFVPVGWYPTALRVRAADGALVVAEGKGTGSARNDTAPPDTSAWCGYLSYALQGRGSVAVVPAPGPAALAKGTRAVLAARPEAARRAKDNPVPARPGERSPIRHVFYVFKENRAYDQVLGDLPRGDGDSSLCLFGERITPNHHALARDFVLLDNTYCEADGSADGHNWGMGAYTTDYVAKSVATSPVYDYEGGNDLAYPESGYLWDACRRAGVTYRSYGEFVFNPDDPRDTVRAGLPGLEGHTAPHYRGYDLAVSDLDRYHAWLEEFDAYDRDGGLPQLSIIRLPNDHTEGTCSGRPTPRAHVAENDLALGLMVERISRSRYWASSAVFVIEDDAANGPDHVDAHRTVALVASPWARRGAVDHTLYSNAGMLRTIELILGLTPMSRFDAAATPMFASFTGVPDPAPWTHRPAGVDLEERNLAGAYGQERSERMNWRVADAVPPDEVAEILWRATKGADAPLPRLVRAAFALRPAGAGPPRDPDDD